MSTTEHEASTAWLTQQAYDRLRAELDSLIAGRPQMSAEINARREEGDLKENGGYHAAKEEQGRQEARIRQLEDLLRGAHVGEAAADNGVVEPGKVVTVEYGDGDTERFLLGAREIAATSDITVYSPDSALGTAITGRSPGDTVTYTAPSGAQIKVTVVESVPFTA